MSDPIMALLQEEYLQFSAVSFQFQRQFVVVCFQL